MQGEASLKKELTALSSRVVLTAKISCTSGVLSVVFLGEVGALCGAVLNGDRLCTMDGTSIAPYVPGEEILLRLVLDTELGEYDVWANSRMLCRTRVLSDRVPLAVSVSCDGKGTLDNLYVFDDTELYVACEEFDSGTDAVSSGGNADCRGCPSDEDAKSALSRQTKKKTKDASGAERSEQEKGTP